MADALWVEERMLIDGELVSAAGATTFENVNPATEEVIGVVADGNASDMERAIGAAHRAFDESGWRDDVAFRVRCLRQLQDAFVKHADAFSQTLVAEIGTPVALLNFAQWDTPVSGIGWVADMLEGYDWEHDLGVAEVFGMSARRKVMREPIGVVGAITPWNFPVQINIAKVVPALAAGNSVVLKPAPDSPWAATLMGALVAEHTDIPAGVFNVVTSSDHSVGEVLTTDPRVDMITFTGSTATGRRIMGAAAPTIKKVFLELGGKSAHIILDDADLEAAVGGGAFGVTFHAGQGCAITTRMLVPRSRWDEAVDIAKATMGVIPYGDPLDPSNLMGPVISERQRERVLGYIVNAVDDGAKVAAGGGIPEHLPKGWFVEPTLLVGVDENAAVAQEEIFGPVLVMLPHDGDDDAVRIANSSIYGLSGAVSSGSQERAEGIARRLRTGTVSINGGVWYGPDVPFGGYRQSGLGRESGVMGFEEYLETKSIATPA
jgi:aldehyde dehydrogenase (NAD+)